MKKEKVLDFNYAVASGNRKAKIRCNKAWRKLVEVSPIFNSEVIKDKKKMYMLQFVFEAGYDSGILDDL